MAAKGRKGLRRKPPRWLHPDTAQREYARALLAIVQQARAAALTTLPEVAAALRSHAAQRSDADRLDAPADGSNAVRVMGERVRSAFTQAIAEAAAAAMAQQVAAFNKAQFRRVVKAVIGVDVFGSEPWLVDALGATVVTNVSLIRNVGEQAAVQIEGLVTQALRNGIGQDDLAEQIQGRFNVADSRAKLIARDQVSKLNGDLTKQRQTDIGIKTYTWSTSSDERVRPSHQAHEGKTFKWASPPADTGHPGDDFQCRCVATPNIEELLTDLENS